MLMLRRLLCASLLLMPLAAFALTLDEARDHGLVGEDFTGYVASVSPNPSPDVRALIVDVNGKRQAVYAQIAKQTSTPTDPVTADDVGRLGAGKIFDKAP